MKKIILIVFAGIFLYACMGYFIVFQVLQYQAKSDIQSKIKSSVPKSELTLVHFTKQNASEFFWMEAGKEFFYQGNLFDVVKKEIHSSEILFYCINDQNEGSLFANLNLHIQNQISNNVSHNKNTKSILQNIVKDYFFVQFFNPCFINSKPILFVNKEYALSEYSLTILSPPPKSTI